MKTRGVVPVLRVLSARKVAVVAALAAFLWGASLLAQPADDEPEANDNPPHTEDSGVSEEEMQELMEGLKEDTAAQEEEGGDQGDTQPAQSTFSRVVQSMNPDISLVLDTALAVYSVQDPPLVGGHDPATNGFNFQQLELALGAAVDPFFRFDANLVFSLFGVEVEEAYATTLSLPWNLQVRAGQFLTRFGRINATHPHQWSFVDQPLVIGKFFGSEGSRGLGAELSWLSPLPWYLELVGSVNGADGDCCARSFIGGNDLPVRNPLDVLYTVALKQFFPFGDDWGLMWGLSGQFGPNASGNGNRTEIYGTDVYLRWRPVDAPTRTAISLTVEALFRTRQVPFDVLQDFGGYASLVWNIDPNWEIGARSELVTGADQDPLDPDWDSNRQRYAVEATWYPSHFSRIRLQGSVDDRFYSDRLVWGGVLSLELIAGAHGAHSY